MDYTELHEAAIVQCIIFAQSKQAELRTQNGATKNPATKIAVDILTAKITKMLAAARSSHRKSTYANRRQVTKPTEHLSALTALINASLQVEP